MDRVGLAHPRDPAQHGEPVEHVLEREEAGGALAAWRGVRALAGLIITLVGIAVFLLPALLHGRDPLALALVAGAAILMVVVPLVHGVNWKSASALAGTLTSVAETAMTVPTAMSMAALLLRMCSSPVSVRVTAQTCSAAMLDDDTEC